VFHGIVDTGETFQQPKALRLSSQPSSFSDQLQIWNISDTFYHQPCVEYFHLVSRKLLNRPTWGLRYRTLSTSYQTFWGREIPAKSSWRLSGTPLPPGLPPVSRIIGSQNALSGGTPTDVFELLVTGWTGWWQRLEGTPISLSNTSVPPYLKNWPSG